MQSANVDASRTVNLYPERNPATAKSPVALYGTPGTVVFATLNALDSLIRQIYEINGRTFAAGKINLVELLADKTVIERGVINLFGPLQTLTIYSAGAGYSVNGIGSATLNAGGAGYSAGVPGSLTLNDAGSGYSAAGIATASLAGGGLNYVAGAIGTVTLNDPGTGYTAADVLNLAGGTAGQVTVDTVDGSGVILTFHLSAAGRGYSVSTATTTGGTGGGTAKFNIPLVLHDVLTVVQAGATAGTVQVDTVNAAGTVLTFHILTLGRGYAVAVGLATTCAPPGIGAGATITITAVVHDVITLDQAGASGAAVRVETVNGAGAILTWTLLPGGLNYAVGTVATSGALSGGTGATFNIVLVLYDWLTVVQGGATGGVIQVDRVAGGAVIEFSIVTRGKGYSVATGLATTGGSGIGAKFNITSAPKDVLDLVQDGASAGTIQVETVGAGGDIVTFSILNAGAGYRVANAVPTTGGVGTGATFNITATLSDTRPVSMVGSKSQMIFVSGDRLYGLDLATNDLIVPEGLQGTVETVGYCDGYGIALLKDSKRFQYSAPGDLFSWNPLDIAEVTTPPDNIVSMLVDHRLIWLFGRTKTSVWYNSGNADNPWEPHPSGFIEAGCGARKSPTRIDNSIVWIGEDDRGSRVVWRANGFTPVRVSDHAVEYAMSQMAAASITDAVGYSYVEQGHTFYRIYFPNAGTWAYDVATNMWAEVGYWAGTGYNAHRSQCHAFAFGKHLVGDWYTATIYEMSLAYSTDAGTIIRRLRRAPHLAKENRHLFYSEFVLDLDPGPIHGEYDNTHAYTGVAVGAAGVGGEVVVYQGYLYQCILNSTAHAPTNITYWQRIGNFTLRYSNDGGKSWPTFTDVNGVVTAGRAITAQVVSSDHGWLLRLAWRRLGRSRDRIFEVYSTDGAYDNVPIRFTDAYLKLGSGADAQEAA